jgi:hypothetical protein
MATPVLVDVFHPHHVENGRVAKGWPQLTSGVYDISNKREALK